jgi:hypothetical protein
MARRVGGLAALAAGVLVASLVIAQVVSGRNGDRGQLTALFIVLLAAVFGLLAVAVVDSEHGAEQISATPHWSLRAAIRRLLRRVLFAVAGVVRRIAGIVGVGLTRAARATSTGTARLRHAIAAENRSATRETIRRHWIATMTALGLPPDDDERELPSEGLDAMPTLPRVPLPRHDVARVPTRTERTHPRHARPSTFVSSWTASARRRGRAAGSGTVSGQVTIPNHKVSR